MAPRLAMRKIGWRRDAPSLPARATAGQRMSVAPPRFADSAGRFLQFLDRRSHATEEALHLFEACRDVGVHNEPEINSPVFRPGCCVARRINRTRGRIARNRQDFLVIPITNLAQFAGYRSKFTIGA